MMSAIVDGGLASVYFDGVRAASIACLKTPRSRLAWAKDRLAFPWLALISTGRALEARLTPLDLERFRAVLPWVRGRLLDVGCGDNLLVQAYGSGVGADVVDWGQVDVLLAADGTLPFESGSFDTVSILASLNHIAEREVLLGECRRVLAPGGRLIVTMLTPWVSVITHRVRHSLDPDQTHRHQDSGEVWGLWPKDMVRLVQRAGFTVERSIPFVWNLNRIYIAARE